jgi:hypothetical protein
LNSVNPALQFDPFPQEATPASQRGYHRSGNWCREKSVG